jgi:hypothetical protein
MYEPPNVDPVAVPDLARRLMVADSTVNYWRHRGELPAPRWQRARNFLWDWRRDVEPWAIETGRARDKGSAAEPCPSCGGAMRTCVALHRPGGHVGRIEPVEQGDLWHSCRVCGWSSFEPVPEPKQPRRAERIHR